MKKYQKCLIWSIISTLIVGIILLVTLTINNNKNISYYEVKSISITNGDTSVSIPVASTGNSSNKFSISVDGTSHAGALPPKSTYQIRLTDSSKIAPKWLSIENDEITWTNAPQEVQTFNIFLIVSAQTTSAYSHDVMISVVTI